MGILYTISILAFAALLWAVLSVARHVRQSHGVDESVVPPAPRPSPGNRPFLDPTATAPRKPARPFEFFDPREFHAHPTQHRPAPSPAVDELQTHDLPIHGVRRQPRQAPAARVSDRLDWAYFNKDLGDLTDPEPSKTIRNTPRPNIKQAWPNA